MLLKNVEVVITCPDTFIKEDGDSKPKQIKIQYGFFTKIGKPIN